MQQISYTMTTPTASKPESETDKLRREIQELKIKNEELTCELDSLREDAIYFRDIVLSSYDTFRTAACNMRITGNFKKARYYMGNAVAYRNCVETFDDLRKIRA